MSFLRTKEQIMMSILKMKKTVEIRQNQTNTKKIQNKPYVYVANIDIIFRYSYITKDWFHVFYQKRIEIK